LNRRWLFSKETEVIFPANFILVLPPKTRKLRAWLKFYGFSFRNEGGSPIIMSEEVFIQGNGIREHKEGPMNRLLPVFGGFSLVRPGLPIDASHVAENLPVINHYGG
jgi:hypothetical protein